MVDGLTFWLESIVEDDPLPCEVDCVVFKVCSCGEYKYLELLGMENTLNLNNVFYRPLEAQFFSLKEILAKNDELFLYRLKNAIDNAFSSIILKQQFNRRKIYLYYLQLEFLFEIK